MWVISITSRILGCATNTNCIPLGSRANTSGFGHPLRKPQHSLCPHTYRMEGYKRPTMDGGRTMPSHGPKLVNSMPVSKLEHPLQHARKNVTRSEGSLAAINPDLDYIKILNPGEAMDLSKYCRGHRLFTKWGGNNQPLTRIVEWWKTTFHGQKPQEIARDNHRAPKDIISIQINSDKGGFIINTSQQENDNIPTLPPSLVLNNSLDRADNNKETHVYDNEDQIQAELNNVIENLMGKLAEEFVEEGNSTVSPTLEESPVVEGLNTNEEREFIINELINMQEKENNIVLDNSSINPQNRGILQMGGQKLTTDCGKSMSNKRGQNYFLDKRKMDGDAEG
ncbi:hypothetical protein SUGI_0479080 [Cryptomeria japonica]|nr:hypothetical protein SUGI_0479080 [Cryptomeria japonica]